jgi:tetratricopeptide (TPR) repeat protein
MKHKSGFFIIFVGVLAMILVMSICSPLEAQKTKKDSQTVIKISQKAGKKPAAVRKNADYWFDKGALCATYGNDKAAIQYFQKAIMLDPQRSGAYFGQGVSFGQLGDYIKAVSLIDKAIALDPQNGLYYYGRGRVYLLAGEKQKAMEDFKKAAGLNDEDAMNYLDSVASSE